MEYHAPEEFLPPILQKIPKPLSLNGFSGCEALRLLGKLNVSIGVAQDVEDRAPILLIS